MRLLKGSGGFSHGLFQTLRVVTGLVVGMLFCTNQLHAQSGFPPSDPCASPQADPCLDPTADDAYWESAQSAVDGELTQLRLEVDYISVDFTSGRFHVEGLADWECFTQNHVVRLVLRIPGNLHELSVALCGEGRVLRFVGPLESCLEFFELDLETERFRAWGNQTMDPSSWMSYATSEPPKMHVSVTLTTGPLDPNPLDPCEIVEVCSGTDTILTDHNGGVLSYVGAGAPPTAGVETIDPAPPFAPIDQATWNDYAMPGVLVVTFKVMDETVYTSLAAVGATVTKWDDEYPCEELVVAALPAGTEAASMELLLQDPNVDSVCPDFMRSAHGQPPLDPRYDPSTPPFPPPPSLNPQLPYLHDWPRTPTGAVTEVHGSIDLPEAWDMKRGYIELIRVGISDTGMDLDHADLDDHYLRSSYPRGPIIGYNYWGGPPEDDNGHGTGVGGIACAETHFAGDPENPPGSEFEIAGIARVRVIPAKALDSAGNGPWIAEYYSVRFLRDQACSVINMSSGGRTPPWYARTGFNAVKKQIKRGYYYSGVYYCASSGNDAAGNPQYPARWPWVDAVGATTYDAVDPTFTGLYQDSNRGVDLVAPGANITSLNNSGSSSDGLYGTSYASPHVAGVAALMKSADPWMSNFQIRSELRRTAEPKNPPSTFPYRPGANTWFGAGLINAARAVQPVATHPVFMPHQMVTVSGSYGGYPYVKIWESTGETLLNQFALPPDRYAGAEVALGNFDGDGFDEIVVGGSPGSIPNVLIYQPDGQLLVEVVTGPWPTGRRVAAGNVLGGLEDELIVGYGINGLPRIEVWGDFNPPTFAPTLLWEFDAFSVAWFHQTGVSVATGDIDGDGYDEVIVGSGFVDAPTSTLDPDERRVAVYNVSESPIPPLGTWPPSGLPDTTTNTQTEYEFAPWHDVFKLAGEATFLPMEADIWVASGDTDGDGADEIVVGAGKGSTPEVRVFELDVSGPDPSIERIARFRGHPPGWWTGVRVAVGHLDFDTTTEEILASSDDGDGLGYLVRGFWPDGTRMFTRFSPMWPYSYAGGIRTALGRVY